MRRSLNERPLSCHRPTPTVFASCTTAGTTSLSGEGLIGQTWALFAGGAYTWNRDQIAAGFVNDKKQQSGQARFTLARPLGEYLKVKFGAEYLQGRYDESYRDSDYGYRYRHRPSGHFCPPGQAKKGRC